MERGTTQMTPKIPFPETPAPQPTAEQLTILDRVTRTTSNIMIVALAGTGKTTTLEMIEEVAEEKPILYLAFNRKIADDATKRMASTTTVRTFNSLGHRIWAKTIGKSFRPDPKKIPDMLRAWIGETKSKWHKDKLWDNFWGIVEGVNKARSVGYIPASHVLACNGLCNNIDDFGLDEDPDESTLAMINILLTRSIAAAYQGFCDFNDQIYMPTLFGGNFPNFPLVLVDEYQDLNPINHAMVAKLVSKTSRLVGVGDPHQSIYEFRGAMEGGMGAAIKRHSATVCDLSISFRCPQAIVESVRWHVPKFCWIKSGGSVEVLSKIRIEDIPEKATFICRNNAPLCKLAMRLLSSGRSVSVAGSDIGVKLIAQMKKLGDSSMPQKSVIAAIDEWLDTYILKGSRSAQDNADCMRVFASYGETLSLAIAYAERLFDTHGKITFITGHKAKGLEWPTVYHLDPWLIGTSLQERNLSYVISTRSSDRLFFINSEDVR
jgi:superfamily I DNA/RNA helicase